MGLKFTSDARRFGIAASVATVFFGLAYLVPLVFGLLSLTSPQDPIGDPWFSVMEILIILLMPPMVSLMVAVHAWASPERQAFSLLAIVFVGLLAGVTCSVHFVILTLGDQAAFAGQPWHPLFLKFKWPSVVYALDILAWDLFFPLSVLCAAAVFTGSRLAVGIRVLMTISGVLALAGLSGVLVDDMRLRNIGVVGYAGVFPVAAALLAVLFRREPVRGLTGSST